MLRSDSIRGNRICFQHAIQLGSLVRPGVVHSHLLQREDHRLGDDW